MGTYQIFSDSSCDLPDCLWKEYNIKLIPFYVSFDQDIYYKENVEITKEAFFERLSDIKAFATTSLPTVQDYINEFKAAIKNGNDVLCLCLSQKFSGSYQSALNAKNILEEQYPQAKIQVIDSIQATAGQGLLLLQIVYLSRMDLTLEQVVEKIETLKPTSRIMFTVDRLEYLAKGRRIGKVMSLVGDRMEVKPLIQLKDGELIPYSKVHGRINSLEKVFEMTQEYFTKTGESPLDYDFCIANADTMGDALFLQNLVEDFIGHKLVYPIFQIGVTIGTYAGPGSIGICFIKKYNRV